MYVHIWYINGMTYYPVTFLKIISISHEFLSITKLLTNQDASWFMSLCNVTLWPFFSTGEKGTICTPSGEMSLNCSAQATDATRICFCKGTEELYKLAPRGGVWWVDGKVNGWKFVLAHGFFSWCFFPMSSCFSPCFFPFRGAIFHSPCLKVPKLKKNPHVPGSNVCPDQYRAIESVEDCQEAAGAGMQGLPPPSSWEKNDPNNQGHRWMNGGSGWKCLGRKGEVSFFFCTEDIWCKEKWNRVTVWNGLGFPRLRRRSSATSIISCEKWVLTWFQPLIVFQPTRGIFGFQTPGSPSSCFKDLETGKVRFNSISMRGFEKLDEWQKLDHRKICKKAFSHLDFLNLFWGGKRPRTTKTHEAEKTGGGWVVEKGTGLVFFCVLFFWEQNL